MSFLETPRFPLRLTEGTVGGPMYLTDIVGMDSGYEARDSRWDMAMFRYDAAGAVSSRENLYALRSFFHVVKGDWLGFRVKDWGDYKSCSPDGTPTALDQVLEASATEGQTEVQLIKTYSAGGFSTILDIQKPVAGTVLIAVNDIPLSSGWTLGAVGIITFSPGLSEGDVVKGGYEWDVPCRFNLGLNPLPTQLKLYRAGEVSVPIIGIRVED